MTLSITAPSNTGYSAILSNTTLITTALRVAALGLTKLRIVTFSIITLSITMFSKMILNAYAEYPNSA
jgi:hypothetical protein